MWNVKFNHKTPFIFCYFTREKNTEELDRTFGEEYLSAKFSLYRRRLRTANLKTVYSNKEN